MKYVEIKAVEVNNISPDRLEDSVLLAVDETKTKVEEVPSVLRKIIKKKYNVREFGEAGDQSQLGRRYDALIREETVTWIFGGQAAWKIRLT